MKIVTWNCQQAFAKKAPRIFRDTPDIVVIQECSKKSAEMWESEGYAGTWVGKNPNKGMAVFGRQGWNVRRIAEPKRSDPRWLVPFEVTGALSFTLIAVWACAVKGNRRESYVGQIHKALRWRREWFGVGPIVIAGDFNSNAIFDRNRPKANHTTMVNELREKYGLVSAYHVAYKMEHGAEEAPTFHLYRHIGKPYHFDYIFVPTMWCEVMTADVGRHCDWSSDSDHCPLWVEIAHESAKASAP
jgi:exonuclease III